MRSLPFVACLVLLCLGGAGGRFDLRTIGCGPRRGFRSRNFPTALALGRAIHPCLTSKPNGYWASTTICFPTIAAQTATSVNFYVAYYASQRKGESPHSPIVCIPGGGWTITNIQQTNLGDGDHSFNRVVIKKRDATQLVYYWFDERGRTLASEIWAKLYLFADAILQNRTDGALVRLTTPIEPSESERDADKRLQAFMHDAVPQIVGIFARRQPRATKSAKTSAFEKRVATQ